MSRTSVFCETKMWATLFVGPHASLTNSVCIWFTRYFLLQCESEHLNIKCFHLKHRKYQLYYNTLNKAHLIKYQIKMKKIKNKIKNLNTWHTVFFFSPLLNDIIIDGIQSEMLIVEHWLFIWFNVNSKHFLLQANSGRGGDGFKLPTLDTKKHITRSLSLEYLTFKQYRYFSKAII